MGFGNTRPAAVERVYGLRERGSPLSGERSFTASTGDGYVAPVEGDYARPMANGLEVQLLLFETLGGFGDEVHGLLTRAAAEVSNRLTSVQYDETTWSAQSWMAFAVQRISVALHSAVAHEAARVYNARAHAAAGDPRFGAGG